MRFLGSTQNVLLIHYIQYSTFANLAIEKKCHGIKISHVVSIQMSHGSPQIDIFLNMSKN